ncbi:VIT family protein [Candidatus Saccharibacteria bacterium]|nr:VIT family protein [Candidatus Saccharibacteria bacterium]
MTQNKHELYEDHSQNIGPKLNKLRAAVLGANDGIVSISGLVVGVAGATDSKVVILTAGLAGLIAGAISMAAGEYVSVSSQRDTERALLHQEKFELKNYPKDELHELVKLYQDKGLTQATAKKVASELTDRDVFMAHADAEHSIDPDELVNPWQAAIASTASFLAGAAVPLIAITVPPANMRIPIAFTSVVMALIITGTLSAKVGKAPVLPAIARVVSGGLIAMIITFSIGSLLGASNI